MEILIEKEYLYAGSKGTDSTDYCRQQLKQRGRCLHPPKRGVGRSSRLGDAGKH